MPYDEITRDKLHDADWETLSKKVLHYVLTKRSNSFSIIAKAMTPEDVVKEVIFKTLKGERLWKPDKVDLFKHLMGACDSLLSSKGLYGLKEFKSTDHGEVDFDEFIDKSKNLDKEESELVEQMKKMVKGKFDLSQVLDAILCGIDKPQEISELYGIEPRTISEHKRTLKRYLLKIMGDIK